MTSNDSDKYDLYIVGLGIAVMNHLTREVEEALRDSREVLFAAPSPDVASYLRTVCPRVTDLYPIAYKEGVSRLKAYDVMTAMVIDAALDHPPVTFGLYGHPLMLVYPSQQLVRAAEFINLRIKVLPGISSLDCMLVDLCLDPGLSGLQIYEATEVLARKRPLQSDAPCLLWQVGAVETNLHSESGSRPERFSRIKRHLLQFYPADHRIAAVYSLPHPLVGSQVDWFPLGEIDSHHQVLHQGITLYIPPASLRPVLDEELVRELDSVSHLKGITSDKSVP